MRNLNSERINRYKRDHTFTKYFFFEDIVPNSSSFLNIVIDKIEYKLAIERLTIRTFSGDDYKRNRNTYYFNNNSYRVALVIDGESNVYIDNQIQPIDSHYIFLQTPGKQLSVTPKAPSECTVVEFLFDLCSDQGDLINIPITEYLSRLFGVELKPTPELSPIDIETKEELEVLLFELYDELTKYNMTKLDHEVNLVIFRLLSSITHCFRSEKYDRSLPRLHKVIHLLENNYSKNYTIDELAQTANLSKHYFQNLFKKTYGVTPIEYLTHVRMKHAKFMMNNYRYSTSEIAYSVGYKSPYYFSRVFKQHTSLSPREYRKKKGLQNE